MSMLLTIDFSVRMLQSLKLWGDPYDDTPFEALGLQSSYFASTWNTGGLSLVHQVCVSDLCLSNDEMVKIVVVVVD